MKKGTGDQAPKLTRKDEAALDKAWGAPSKAAVQPKAAPTVKKASAPRTKK